MTVKGHNHHLRHNPFPSLPYFSFLSISPFNFPIAFIPTFFRSFFRFYVPLSTPLSFHSSFLNSILRSIVLLFLLPSLLPSLFRLPSSLLSVVHSFSRSFLPPLLSFCFLSHYFFAPSSLSLRSPSPQLVLGPFQKTILKNGETMHKFSRCHVFSHTLIH